MEKDQYLAKSETFKNLKSKCVGFTLAQVDLAELMVAYSDEFGRLFRTIPAACSEPFRPPVPNHSGHLFRYKSAS